MVEFALGGRAGRRFLRGGGRESESNKRAARGTPRAAFRFDS